jgi:hypothetical protein
MFTTTKDAEPKLVELLTSIKDEANHWRAIHFRFSLLQEHYRSNYQIKIAVNLINDLLKTNQGGLFVFADFNLYVVAKSVTKTQIDKVIFQLRYLFADDPLAYDADGNENPEFCEIYDLSVAYDEFTSATRKKVVKTAKKVAASQRETSSTLMIEDAPAPKTTAKTTTTAKAAGSSAFGSEQLIPLTTQRLANIERDLESADLSRVMRRQPICAAVPNMMVRRVFDEFYVNIAHLKQMMTGNVDLTSNRWLFKYLTQVLDARMLEMIGRNAGRYIDRPISINLNVETLLSDYFTRFDALIKPSMKVSIVIEIQIADVFSDMAAFMVAKETVQKLGYRVCLDGLTSLSFTQIDREKLGFDLAKLQWNADLESDLKSRENKQLADAVRQCGPNRIILCRCDGRQAVDYGQALGISLFQGRFLDKIIDPTSKVEN